MTAPRTSATFDAPEKRKRLPANALSPLGGAVLTWVQALPGCPISGGFSSSARNVGDAMMLSYMKTIVSEGLAYFNRIAETIEDFPGLEKEMTRCLMRPVQMVSKKELLRRKVARANATWKKHTEVVSPTTPPSEDSSSCESSVLSPASVFSEGTLSEGSSTRHVSFSDTEDVQEFCL